MVESLTKAARTFNVPCPVLKCALRVRATIFVRQHPLDFALGALLLFALLTGAGKAQEPSASTGGESRTVIRTTVRRVVLDVVVTDPKGAPAAGLTKNDFTVTEDGRPQRILSFDANGFSPAMDYVPPPLPPQPANTFINLPATPEKGPLYVLLYDLTDMDDPSHSNSPEAGEQMIARQQIVKFIQDKPEGTRFAIFVRSDGLHLVQGFTADKQLLYQAIDPKNPKPHVPMVFLDGSNYGRGYPLSALYTLHYIASFVEGLPGRKNLIWFSSQFPLPLFASDPNAIYYQEETKATLDTLAQNQIAVYPVDARGVPANDAKFQVMRSYEVMDKIAQQTGGRAFYGTNDIVKELVDATDAGGVYYTLTYAPTNTEYDGKLRNIHVELTKKGYDLAYRRAYYGTESPDVNVATTETTALETSTTNKTEPAQLPVVDRLSANMQHGAPTAHQLVFVVQAHTLGAPAEGTPQEMADLATEPAYFKTRRRSAAAKPLAPISLQKDVFTFNVPIRQFKYEPTLDLEVAVAVFDADGQLMNAVVRIARKEIAPASDTGNAQFYRIEQELKVPLAASSVRFAVRDTANDRTGAMEIPLPLAPENELAPGGG